jgi:hypothetical protein
MDRDSRYRIRLPVESENSKGRGSAKDDAGGKQDRGSEPPSWGGVSGGLRGMVAHGVSGY